MYYREEGATDWSTTAPTNVGTYNVKIDVAINDDYGAATALTNASWQFTIVSKALDVSVADVVILKGQSIPTLTVNVTGFVDGEGESLAGYSKPSATVSGEVDTCDTSITTFAVSYSDGNATSNYTFDKNAIAQITIHTVAVVEGDYSVSKDITQWQKDSIVLTPGNGYNQISADGENWATSLTLETEGAERSQTFYLKKADGTVSESKSIQYKLDKTAPTNLVIQYGDKGFSSLRNTASFGSFCKGTVEVTAGATDDLSGVASYQYYASDVEIYDFANIVWKDSLSLMPNSKNIVYVKAIDNSGNESIANFEGVVVYSDSIVTPKAAVFDKNTAKQEDIEFCVDLNDNMFKDIKNGTSTLIKDTDYFINGDKITITKSYLASQNIGDITLTFTFYPMGISTADALSAVNVNITDGITTETQTSPDGTVVVTKKDASGTVLEITETRTDGSKTLTEYFPDGSKIVTTYTKDGVSSTKEYDPSGNEIHVQDGSGDQPVTGDSTNLMLWIILLPLLAGTLAMLYFMRRKGKVRDR